MKFTYKPNGVCSQLYEIEIDDNDVIQAIKITGGCNGNLQGISKLITGMKAQDVISKIEGIKCGFKQTSCPDQISKALISYLNSK